MFARDDIADLTRNRWREILPSLGIDAGFLRGAHTPCPLCGGKDRFRFNDWQGKGRWLCNHCTPGGGDGFNLLQRLHGWNFRETADQIRCVLGGGFERLPSCTSKPREKRNTGTASQRTGYARHLWHQSEAVTLDDPVDRYLKRRTGIVEMPLNVRYKPEMIYRNPDGSDSAYPAMIARVQDADGRMVAVHRTYLTPDGYKADVPNPKQVSGNLPPGSAVRLYSPSEKLGIAEGIETAISAAEAFDVPVWAALSANGLSCWIPPQEATEVIIFGDNDGAGRNSAQKLHDRLNGTISVEVMIPEGCKDWNDQFNSTAASINKHQ
jgi:putative DNA primase/helicase